MTILRGHEDLRLKAVVGFDMGFALVQCGEGVKRYRLMIGPTGTLHGEPVDEKSQVPDQLQSETEDLRARSMRTIDQL